MIYLSGPMAGIKDHNFPLFHAVTERLRAEGELVCCPAELNKIEDEKTWVECLKVDLTELLKCDAIAFLPGWHNSRGATLEMITAMLLDMVLFEVRHTKKQTFLVPTLWNPTIVNRAFYLKHIASLEQGYKEFLKQNTSGQQLI